MEIYEVKYSCPYCHVGNTMRYNISAGISLPAAWSPVLKCSACKKYNMVSLAAGKIISIVHIETESYTADYDLTISNPEILPTANASSTRNVSAFTDLGRFLEKIVHRLERPPHIWFDHDKDDKITLATCEFRSRTGLIIMFTFSGDGTTTYAYSGSGSQFNLNLNNDIPSALLRDIDLITKEYT